jgi:hypothetical protein
LLSLLASSLAWRTGGDDDCLFDALQSIGLAFKLGDLALALSQGVRKHVAVCAAPARDQGSIPSRSKQPPF